MHRLPDHLRRFVIQQDYARYTPEDQAVWRYILRQLRDYHSRFAHSSFLDGLRNTGISVEEIPRIEVMNEHLNKFGWSAVAISGFIPPAAFLEFQALGFLPIATEIRTIEHIHYTPAPDIVHESAGHAPILIDPVYSAYLRSYAQIATRAIFSSEDMQQYDAIRELSDLKEDSSTSAERIQNAEKRLAQVSASIRYVSEAAQMARLYWWTAEYGLVGAPSSPKIYGAGLLSSVGEARSCMKPDVKKIPLSIDCVKVGYDITEPQPQIFVTPSFEALNGPLTELAAGMAFKVGGEIGLRRAVESRTVNTIELDSGLQVSGILTDFAMLPDGNTPRLLKLTGPCQIAVDQKQLPGHGTTDHPAGLIVPLGWLAGGKACPSLLSDADLDGIGLRPHRDVALALASGVQVKGHLDRVHRISDRVCLLEFDWADVRDGSHSIHDRGSGPFAMPIGSSVVSVFGGPADGVHFGERLHFTPQFLKPKAATPEQQARHEMYRRVRELRNSLGAVTTKHQRLSELIQAHSTSFADQWLIGVELHELARRWRFADLTEALERHLDALSMASPRNALLIDDGRRLADTP